MPNARAKRKGDWQLQDAKAHLSELVDRAAEEGPQVITRRGRKEAVVISFEAYSRLTSQRESLVDMLLRSPLRGSGLVVDRDDDRGREIDFEP